MKVRTENANWKRELETRTESVDRKRESNRVLPSDDSKESHDGKMAKTAKPVESQHQQ